MITDSEFDKIAKQLLENYNAVEKSNHIHKHLISKDMLTGTTAFSLTNKYPNIIKICATQMIFEHKNRNKISLNDLF